jgi:parallel beta-helix repeat protein
MKAQTLLATIGLVAGLGLAPGAASAAPSVLVNCNSPNASIQDAVDGATGPTTISIKGVCQQDVVFTKDDMTLSGKEPNTECNKADPSASAAATIDGTITVDGVRANLEFLEITGNGAGVLVTNRADARLTCNDISDNQASGVLVIRTSNAVLTDNTLSGNGAREANPFIHFDVGLFIGNASSVQSNGNTYTDNQYAAIESDRQSAFRNASFLPREPGHPPVAAEKDVIIQKGADPADPATCKTNTGGPLAVITFNIGHAEFRNADICGEIEVGTNSTFRIDDAGGELIGNVTAGNSSFVRIRDRSGFGDGRLTTFDGTLSCFGFSGTFGSSVQCGQTCGGNIPGTCSF